MSLQKLFLSVPDYAKEIFTYIQRIVMVVLTVALLITMIRVGNQIVIVKDGIEKARVTAEEMQKKITDLTTEIHKGIRIRLW